MFVVGLTGGIASGKTRVANAFHALGAVIVDTDVIARQVVEPGSDCLEKIHAYFGDKILLQDGSLDRKTLRDLIFTHPSKKKWLESIMHPRIREMTRKKISTATGPYCLLVSPLLLESPDAALCQRILVVDAPESLQIERATSRDNVPEDQIKTIIAQQTTREKRLQHADDILDNSGDWKHTEAKILPLHQKYLQCAKEFLGHEHHVD